MTLNQALEIALKILKQVMEEKLNSSNVEVSIDIYYYLHYIFEYVSCEYDLVKILHSSLILKTTWFDPLSIIAMLQNSRIISK